MNSTINKTTLAGLIKLIKVLTCFEEYPNLNFNRLFCVNTISNQQLTCKFIVFMYPKQNLKVQNNFRIGPISLKM